MCSGEQHLSFPVLNQRFASEPMHHGFSEYGCKKSVPATHRAGYKSRDPNKLALSNNYSLDVLGLIHVGLTRRCSTLSRGTCYRKFEHMYISGGSGLW